MKDENPIPAQTQRLASLGFMLASVCHEVSNPLAAVSSMLQILQSKRGVTPETLEKGLASISANVARVLAITKKLGDYSRVGGEAPAPLAIDDAVEAAAALLRHSTSGHGVRLDYRGAPGVTVLARPGELEQVVFNIVGSYGCGALGGRYSKRLLLAWIYAIRAVAIGVFIAAPLTPAGTYLFAAVLGLTWLGTVPLTNSLVGQIFGVKFLSTLFSISFLGHQLGAFIGAWAGGAVFDLTGSYNLVWFISVALSVVAAALCIPINERALRPA